jgi:hypothetical protein
MRAKPITAEIRGEPAMMKLLIVALAALALIGGIAAVTTIDSTPVYACINSNC